MLYCAIFVGFLLVLVQLTSEDRVGHTILPALPLSNMCSEFLVPLK